MITNTSTKLPLTAEYFGPKVKSRHSSVEILEKNEFKHSSNIAKEYADATSLHGLKYIAEDERHPIERYVWELFYASQSSRVLRFPSLLNYKSFIF